jgi:hypothetical protein
MQVMSRRDRKGQQMRRICAGLLAAVIGKIMLMALLRYYSRKEQFMSVRSILTQSLWGLALATTVAYLCGAQLSLAQSVNKSTEDAKSSAHSLPTVRLRAGSKSPFKDSKGNVWLPDVESAEGGFDGGELADRPDDMVIQNTKEQGLYHSEHWGMDSFSYKLPNGKYLVKLHFAETYDGIGGPGDRVFSFKVQDKEFKDFDVWEKAGGPRRAYIEKVPVEITDGKLKITFTANADNPEINGIEIIPADQAAAIDKTSTTDSTSAK